MPLVVVLLVVVVGRSVASTTTPQCSHHPVLNVNWAEADPQRRVVVVSFGVNSLHGCCCDWCCR
jgi:hypothetical protein